MCENPVSWMLSLLQESIVAISVVLGLEEEAEGGEVGRSVAAEEGA